jgi:hypothetical protein
MEDWVGVKANPESREVRISEHQRGHGSGGSTGMKPSSNLNNIRKKKKKKNVREAFVLRGFGHSHIWVSVCG